MVDSFRVYSVCFDDSLSYEITLEIEYLVPLGVDGGIVELNSWIVLLRRSVW